MLTFPSPDFVSTHISWLESPELLPGWLVGGGPPVEATGGNPGGGTEKFGGGMFGGGIPGGGPPGGGPPGPPLGGGP